MYFLYNGDKVVYDIAQVVQASIQVLNKLKASSERVDLNKFNQKKPGGGPPTWVGPLGWYIQKDTAGHGGRI